MHPPFLAFLILLVISVAISIFLFFLLRDSLLELLRHTLKLDAGVTFFLRSFLLLLVLSGLSAAIGTSFFVKPQFMEYVWTVASGLSTALDKILIFVALYLVLITILIATLKIKNDK